MLDGISTTCDIGGKRTGRAGTAPTGEELAHSLVPMRVRCARMPQKKGNNGQTKWWRGYKLHLVVADGNIPISALITSASVHDSQVSIPLIHMTSDRVTYLYETEDAGAIPRQTPTGNGFGSTGSIQNQNSGRTRIQPHQGGVPEQPDPRAKAQEGHGPNDARRPGSNGCAALAAQPAGAPLTHSATDSWEVLQASHTILKNIFRL
ncbi:MAG: transposase [Saprospiraceae bacterium]